MRHATLLLSALVASATAAQDYLANDPVWRVQSVCAVPVPCIATDSYNYFTAGDSVIGNVTWTKVRREGMVTYNWQSAPPAPQGCQGMNVQYAEAYTRLIRQEGRQLRIWSNDNDELLHEFDLVVGQTLPLSYTNWNEDITVVAVDSVLIGTEMRARYELSNSWAVYLIEGVGSVHGLFEPLSNFLECGYALECFGLGAESYYPSSGGSCWLPLAVEHPRPIPERSFSPNPAGAMVYFKAGPDPSEWIHVRDVSGRLVLQLQALGNAALDVSGLPEGCYAVSIGDAAPQRLIVAR